ncbi:MAG TPA: ABC transporter permease [Micromonosporaceae bacterium]|nr:ABC transporter permease [Micromonosporaceae bacterium]HKE66770.1 ABC transporter permease [Micromonosporaceae bacterium]
MTSGRLRARLIPYLTILPGGLWLVVFFVVPMVFMVSLSLQQGDIVHGFQQTWHWQTYTTSISAYKDQLLRSFKYGLISTLLQIVIAYPIAYWIAFRAGARKSFYLFLLLVPFFVSFVLRTISWNFILADNGIVLGTLKDWHLLPQSFHILATGTAVVGGLTYNYLPFMILPIYVALERVDPRLIEAAYDLYATKVRAFRKVILPLSIPGIFAGVVITFVPVSSDYVNAHILGGPTSTMIGNVIQNSYLGTQDYPTASALSFVLMAILLIGIFAYARALGTEEALEVAAR